MAEKLRKKVFCTGDATLDLLYAVVRQVRLDIHFNAVMTEKDVPPTEFLDEFLDGDWWGTALTATIRQNTPQELLDILIVELIPLMTKALAAEAERGGVAP